MVIAHTELLQRCLLGEWLPVEPLINAVETPIAQQNTPLLGFLFEVPQTSARCIRHTAVVR